MALDLTYSLSLFHLFKDCIMNLKKESTNYTSYLPVAWEYREIIEEQIMTSGTGKIFFFCQEGMCEQSGRITEMKEFPGEGIFIIIDNGSRVRIDRIITLFGKPGAAFDEYDAYSNACMDCTGGYEREDLKGYSI